MKRASMLQVLLRVLVTLAVLCVSVAWAQQSSNPPVQTGPGTPIQPLGPLPDGNVQSGPGQTGAEVPGQTQPETHALSGIETLGLSSLRRLGHTFDPSLAVSEFGETGIEPGKTISATNLGGSLDTVQDWNRYNLTFTYNGAETLYRPPYVYGVRNLPYHKAAISQQLWLGRWTLLVRDDLFYSWGPGFGSVFAGGPAAEQTGPLNNLQPSLNPAATIQTSYARELSNSSMAEIDFAPTRRTSLTLVGSFSELHFLDSGYISNQSVMGSVGYNYALSAKNNIALTYDRNQVTYIGDSNRFATDQLQMTFGRKVTGRLALQIAAGPQLLHLYNFGSAQERQLSWSASGSLSYRLHRTGYSISYFRGVTPGSGVFFGARGQTITATASHEFTRFWSASLRGGYARNESLAPTAGFVGRFDNWFTGADLTRSIGRQVHAGLSYGFEQQLSGNGSCPVASCGLGRPFSQFGVTVTWHPALGRSAKERTPSAVGP